MSISSRNLFVRLRFAAGCGYLCERSQGGHGLSFFFGFSFHFVRFKMRKMCWLLYVWVSIFRMYTLFGGSQNKFFRNTESVPSPTCGCTNFQKVSVWLFAMLKDCRLKCKKIAWNIPCEDKQIFKHIYGDKMFGNPLRCLFPKSVAINMHVVERKIISGHIIFRPHIIPYTVFYSSCPHFRSPVACANIATAFMHCIGKMRTYCNHLFSLKRFKFIFQKKKMRREKKKWTNRTKTDTQQQIPFIIPSKYCNRNL